MTGGGVVSLERGVSPQIVRELVKRGHRVSQMPGRYGGYQANRAQSGNRGILRRQRISQGRVRPRLLRTRRKEKSP